MAAPHFRDGKLLRECTVDVLPSQ